MQDKNSLPQKFSIFDIINWDAEPLPVILCVELPFWIMVEDCSLNTQVNGYNFKIEIKSDYSELHAIEVLASKSGRIYIGPMPAQLSHKLIEEIEQKRIPVMPRKCKTVLKIYSTCNSAVLADAREGSEHKSINQHYLRAVCEAHIPVVNKVIQSYRLSTYDYFAYEVSPWDVPNWLMQPQADNDNSLNVSLLSYVDWDVKPQVVDMAINKKVECSLISPADFQSKIDHQPTAGEIELLDAINLMERGDYSGAVRRITTAIEAALESSLRQELLKHHSENEVKEKLEKSKNDFPGRFRQYQKLSGRKLNEEADRHLEKTRDVRHEIVHRGYRITFAGRGEAQRAVDTGRWLFNWLENNPGRTSIRENNIAKRSLGRHAMSSLLSAEITSTGVVVHRPLLV